MAGIGVGITGTGLWLAALVGGLGGAFALVPQLLASSSGDYPGGQYQQVGTLLPPVFGGIVAYILCFLVFDISAYALSAAQLLGLPTAADTPDRGVGRRAVPRLCTCWCPHRRHRPTGDGRAARGGVGHVRCGDNAARAARESRALHVSRLASGVPVRMRVHDVHDERGWPAWRTMPRSRTVRG